MNDEALIRHNIEQWVEEYNRHDAAALAERYAEDSMYITPTGVMLAGPRQIRDYMEASFKRSPSIEIKVQIDQVKTDGPNLAVGRGLFELTNALDPAGKPLPMKGPWLSTFLRRGDRWIPITQAAALTLETYVPVNA
jgi:uncharacterized protein (TIGR02246 family)